MTPDLANWALGLPLAARAELAKVSGPGWFIWLPGDIEDPEPSSLLYDSEEDSRVSGWPEEYYAGKAWLPCDPFGVVRHVGCLTGLPNHRLTTWDPGFRASVFGADRTVAGYGETSIEAAVALLDAALR